MENQVVVDSHMGNYTDLNYTEWVIKTHNTWKNTKALYYIKEGGCRDW